MTISAILALSCLIAFRRIIDVYGCYSNVKSSNLNVTRAGKMAHLVLRT